MADIGRSRGLPKPEDEVVLCTISIDSNNVITIKPDLQSRDTYFIDNSDGDVWEYTLAHVDSDIRYKCLVCCNNTFTVRSVLYLSQKQLPRKLKTRLVIIECARYIFW